MKNTSVKTIGAATILLLAMITQISIFAQEAVEQNRPEAATEREFFPPRGGNARDLEGTWDVLVTIRNCQTGAAIRTFPSVGTFMSGGTTLDSTSGVPQALKTPGHGVWSHIGGNAFRFKFKSFSFDASGNFTGWTIIAHEAKLIQRQQTFPPSRADEYESAGTAAIFAANGNLIATLCSTTIARRFE